MNIVEIVLERRIQKLVNIDSMHFGFMPGRGTTDALFVVRRMQENTGIRKKVVQKKCLLLATCFVNIEKAFDRVPRKVMK